MQIAPKPDYRIRQYVNDLNDALDKLDHVATFNRSELIEFRMDLKRAREQLNRIITMLEPMEKK